MQLPGFAPAAESSITTSLFFLDCFVYDAAGHHLATELADNRTFRAQRTMVSGLLVREKDFP